jgi:RNA polymerase-binding transcription factor DksA
MADEPLSALVRRLRDELDRIEADLRSVRESRSAATGDDEHDPEGSTLSEQWSTLEGRRQDALTHLAEAERAEQRARSGHYGLCITCGRPISPDRLAARPTAEQCMDCATGRTIRL